MRTMQTRSQCEQKPKMGLNNHYEFISSSWADAPTMSQAKLCLLLVGWLVENGWLVGMVNPFGWDGWLDSIGWLVGNGWLDIDT